MLQLTKVQPYARSIEQPARFRIGDRVVARNLHTRLPRYARGRMGSVMHLHGAHAFADSSAVGSGDAPRWLYTVRFSGRELWGEAADAAMSVSAEAWESYLEAMS
jgi:nitrile hydratase